MSESGDYTSITVYLLFLVANLQVQVQVAEGIRLGHTGVLAGQDLHSCPDTLTAGYFTGIASSGYSCVVRLRSSYGNHWHWHLLVLIRVFPSTTIMSRFTSPAALDSESRADHDHDVDI